MHFASGVPTVPVQRRMNLAAVIAARQRCLPRPSWTAIFVKAFARVADEMPELRRAFVKFPRPHLYEYPSSIASVTVEREYEGEQGVFVFRVKHPAEYSLAETSALLRFAATAPLDDVKPFRRALRIAKLPLPLRRLMWWVALNVGRKRANYFGTFAVSVYSALGAESLHPLSPLTTLLNYGVFAADGSCDVRIVYDHRVLDGANVARALARLEEVLRTTIVDELRAASLPDEGPVDEAVEEDDLGRGGRDDDTHEDDPRSYQVREFDERGQTRQHQPRPA